MRRRDEPAVRSRGVEPVARCKRCGLPALEPSEQCRCPDGEDDKITAAKLKAGGWHQSGSLYVNRDGIATLWLVFGPGEKSLWIGGTWDRSWELRTVTGMADLRVLVACLRGEKK